MFADPDNGGISIHAPVKGATGLDASGRQPLGISIHAPVKGATAAPGPDCRRSRYFNPRSREGSDFCLRLPARLWGYFNPRSRKGSDGHDHLAQAVDVAISIHAPVKGATSEALLEKLLVRLQSPLT